MKTIIAGAGHLGTQLAHALSTTNDVTLIDLDEDRIAELDGHLRVRLVEGDACEPAALEKAGAFSSELLIAATDGDEDNLVISLLAKRQFAVPRVVARVNDSDNAWLFDDHWGVDVAIPAETPLISLIEEATGAADTVALLRLAKAGVNVAETAITPVSRTVGKTLADIDLPAGAIVAAIIRDGRPVVPGPRFRLQAGDELLFVSETGVEHEINAAFQ